ncbi:MAG: hypothetical protein ACI9V1_001691 [Spirosomataceae bacterium]|jgi:hypothetical protein
MSVKKNAERCFLLKGRYAKAGYFYVLKRKGTIYLVEELLLFFLIGKDIKTTL